MHEFQAVALQNALDLMFGVDRPRPGGVELYVSAPVLQRFARLAHLLVGERDVVMRVRISGRELNGGLVSVDCFLDASGLVEHVAQVEIGERVARIDLNRRTVMPFGERVFLTVVVERTQVDVRGGMHGIHVENLQVSCDRLALRGGIFFQHDPARKQVGNVGNHQFRSIPRRAGHDFTLFGGEIEHELSGDGLQQPALVPESNAVSAAIGASFEQRIPHAGNLLLHGFERLPDDGRTNALGAEVAHFLDLHQIEKGILFARRHQSCLLPGLKLARNEPENAQQVCAAVARHGCIKLSSLIIRNFCAGMQVATWWNPVEGCGEAGRNGTKVAAFLAGCLHLEALRR